MRALSERIAAEEMPEGLRPVGVTFAWATAPLDAGDGASLLNQADQRLLAHKREARQPV